MVIPGDDWLLLVQEAGDVYMEVSIVMGALPEWLVCFRDNPKQKLG